MPGVRGFGGCGDSGGAGFRECGGCRGLVKGWLEPRALYISKGRDLRLITLRIRVVT